MKIGLYLLVFFIIFSCLSSSVAAQRSMDEFTLSEQADQFAKLTPIVISTVRTDVQEPLETQQQNHQRLATELSNDLNQQNINNTVLTEYEMQKKEIAQNLELQKTVQIPLQYKIVQLGYSAQNNNVRVETDQRITIYVSREAHRQ